MNFKTKLYTAVLSLPYDWFTASPWAATAEPGTLGFHEFHETPPKKQTPGKVWTPRQERIQTHGSERERFLPLGQPLLINWAWRPWYGTFPLASWGSLPGWAPAQLLHTFSWAEQGRLEKVLNFIATTENLSVISILLVLPPKYSSYWEEN